MESGSTVSFFEGIKNLSAKMESPVAEEKFLQKIAFFHLVRVFIKLLFQIFREHFLHL